MHEQSFGYWLKRRRKALDLTQAELADQVGCSAAAIRKIEAEERRPSAQIVERLAEIFNIPARERAAFLRFARGDWRAAPGEKSEESPWHTPERSPRSNLPATVTSLVGREEEIGDVRGNLLTNDIRLVTLIGPPGIGKTRLSVEAARASLPDFRDGVFFSALAALDHPSSVAPAVAQALGYVGTENISTTEQLKKGIGDKHLLLVLDNCEHLIEEVASLASDLLLACAQLKILATSRESLRISGEWLYIVPALDLPVERFSLDVESISRYPALMLFAERARAVRSDFSLDTDNLQTVAAICTHLDGLPLAIELIAARMRLMSPQALLDRLTGQFVLTADGMRAASQRQKTLHNAIEWSYDLLPPEEQKLFTDLSVFSGSFALDTAEELFSRTVTGKPVPTIIASLLNKSLLKLAPGLEGRAEARYTMLATIQEFARERLREMGEETEIRNAHLAYFLDLAEKADQGLRGHDQLEWLSRLDSDRDNLRAALEWAIEAGQTENALRLACRLHWSWFVHGDHNEGRQQLGRVLAMPGASLYPEEYAQALTQIAHHTWIQTEPKEARPFVEQAFSVAEAHADTRNIARALGQLGLVLTLEKEFSAARSTVEESMALFREVRDDWGYAHSMMCLGTIPLAQDDHAATLAIHEHALELFRKLGDRYFQSVALRLISDVRVKQGDWSSAQETMREALTLAWQLGSKYEIASSLWSLGYAVQHAGEPRRGARLAGAASNLLDTIGVWTKENILAFQNDFVPCRDALGDEEFNQAMEEGRIMTMEQAIEYGLEKSTGL